MCCLVWPLVAHRPQSWRKGVTGEQPHATHQEFCAFTKSSGQGLAWASCGEDGRKANLTFLLGSLSLTRSDHETRYHFQERSKYHCLQTQGEEVLGLRLVGGQQPLRKPAAWPETLRRGRWGWGNGNTQSWVLDLR